MPLKPALLLLAASAALAAPRPPRPRNVSIKTADGWTLSARWLEAGKKKAPALALAHGVGSAGGEWWRLADALQLKGVSTLALDLRGHGDSRKGPKGETGPEHFDSTREWERMHEDLHAAARWLEKKGVKSVGLGGASIGANLAARASAERPKTSCVLLLSASADYRGVRPLLRAGLKALAVASPSDPYAHAALESLARAGAETLEAPSGHGVQMFDDPDTFDAIVSWVVENCAPAP